MNKERIKFFTKEVLIFILLLLVVPSLTAYIASTAIEFSGYDKVIKFEDIISLSREIFVLAYLITPLTAKLPNFGKINRWWRFFIVYIMLS